VSLAELCDTVEHVFDVSEFSEEEYEIAPEDFGIRPRTGRLILTAKQIREDLYRLHATFANESPVAEANQTSRRGVQDIAFTSAHLLLGVENGEFISLLEPPVALEEDAKACTQNGVFPVLVGDTGDHSTVLCSPIILYDYPQVAPESVGDFFDGTEMDEMLALRVLTLSDEEQAEMRRGDRHARAILARTQSLSNEQLLKVHGVLRGLRHITEPELANPPVEAGTDFIDQPFDPFSERPPTESVRVFGIELRTGDRVRLWPQKRADIMDLAMEGKVAIIEAIEQDLEDNLQFAVVLEDDPGRDMGMLRQAGHRFFFSPDEVEPLELRVP
jgi:hypothetical protein